MYFSVFPIFTSVSRTLRTNNKISYRFFQRTIQRNKSELISLPSRQNFENNLTKLLCKLSTDNLISPIVIERVEKITECIAYEKGLFRGSLAIFAYETLEKPINITEMSSHQIQTLAWGAEMVNAYFMILDDLDKSREMSIWCHFDHSLIRSFVYETIKSEFMDQPSYTDIVHLFDKGFLNTTAGQILDEVVRRDYKNFTTETYNSIAELKTSFHTLQLPISLATKLIDNVDRRFYNQIQSVSLQLGRLYHMQDDFLDCYGEEIDQSGIPKHSYDIKRGRCSWLAVSALQRCTPAQRIVFCACYGSKEPAHIERVKLLYDHLQMPRIYKEAKAKMCDDIARNARQSILGDTLVLKVLDVIKDRDNV